MCSCSDVSRTSEAELTLTHDNMLKTFWSSIKSYISHYVDHSQNQQTKNNADAHPQTQKTVQACLCVCVLWWRGGEIRLWWKRRPGESRLSLRVVQLNRWGPAWPQAECLPAHHSLPSWSKTSPSRGGGGGGLQVDVESYTLPCIVLLLLHALVLITIFAVTSQNLTLHNCNVT